MTLAMLVDDLMVAMDILKTSMPQLLSKQILTLSLPHNSWNLANTNQPLALLQSREALSVF